MEPCCERWGVLDLADMIAAGKADERTVGRRARCTLCGMQGQWQLRAPVYRNLPAAVAYTRYR